ncbi:MAG: AbrB/MazE/SpoVT family DNA-binding domain-containing protein [Acidocella sp.]|nr:AbrB/MazE/SpoVT family DNA-binding domain-containing protein [Acidocella sp.]
MITSKLTSKAQTTIPQAVRHELGLQPGDILGFVIEGDRVILCRAPPTFTPREPQLVPRMPDPPPAPPAPQVAQTAHAAPASALAVARPFVPPCPPTLPGAPTITRASTITRAPTMPPTQTTPPARTTAGYPPETRRFIGAPAFTPVARRPEPPLSLWPPAASAAATYAPAQAKAPPPVPDKPVPAPLARPLLAEWESEIDERAYDGL